MPTFTGKTFATFYKNLLGINQSSNTGVDATTRAVQDGAGQSSSLSLSDDVLQVQPVNDDSVGTLLCKNNGGDNILAVDTTNKKVLVGSGQVSATTQTAVFGVTSEIISSFTANNHYAIPYCGMAAKITSLDVSFGTGTDPATTFTTSDDTGNRASQIVPMLWLLDDAITIDSVKSFEGADAATGDTTRMHLQSYTFTSGSTSCLTAGTLLASSPDTVNAGDEQAYLSSWTINSADVAANKVILAFFRSDSVNSDYSVTIQIKYHLQ